MHEKYVTLFEELARSTATSAEKVMDYNMQKADKDGFATAEMMRNNYEELRERISKEDYSLTKQDAAKLAIAVLIFISQLQDKIKAMQNAIEGYQNDILPKLKDIVDNAADDTQAAQMANEKFTIQENKEEVK